MAGLVSEKATHPFVARLREGLVYCRAGPKKSTGQLPRCRFEGRRISPREAHCGSGLRWGRASSGQRWVDRL